MEGYLLWKDLLFIVLTLTFFRNALEQAAAFSPAFCYDLQG